MNGGVTVSVYQQQYAIDSFKIYDDENKIPGNSTF